jgi:GH35 family endo-1,4-beta-xylanase
MLFPRTESANLLSRIALCFAATISSLTTASVWSQQADWKQRANQRIRNLRQRDAQIRVLDNQGQPVAGVTVEVKQTQKAFAFGAALSPTILRDPTYQKFFLAHFNWAVFENDMKWYSNEGRRGREDYSRADAMLSWCNEHEIPVRGHCIFWEPEKWQPRWLRGLEGEELRVAVEQRIDSIATRYRGKIVHWDVNNEMLHGTFFQDRLGEGIHAWMFKRAHEVDPQARLFVNEFNVLSVDKDFEETQVDEYVAQIEKLIDAGAPIHGVGIQGHIWSQTVLDQPEILKKNLDKVAKLGLPIWISEYDSAFNDERANADCLEAVYRTAYSHPAVEGIMAWVFWAGNSWRGSNAGLARRDWSLNAAGQRYEVLMDEWSTNASGASDANGFFTFRGFHGNYSVTLRNGSQQPTQQKLRLVPGSKPLVVSVTASSPK